jgi:hypothetical protein
MMQAGYTAALPNSILIAPQVPVTTAATNDNSQLHTPPRSTEKPKSNLNIYLLIY